MVPRNANVADVLDALQRKAGISDEIMKRVRVYETHSHKFYKALHPEFQTMGIPEYLQLYAAPFPEDESSKKVAVFHFDKDLAKPHGIPFQFSLKEVGGSDGTQFAKKTNMAQGEVFSDTKQRLSELTKYKGKQFEKIKFALAHKTAYSRPDYIEDGELKQRKSSQCTC